MCLIEQNGKRILPVTVQTDASGKATITGTMGAPGGFCDDRGNYDFFWEKRSSQTDIRDEPAEKLVVSSNDERFMLVERLTVTPR